MNSNMNKKPILKRTMLIVGSYFFSVLAYVLMESSRLFCPNKMILPNISVFCIDYLWKSIVWSLFYFILIGMLYFVEKKYLTSWKSLILMLFVPTVWSIYNHINIVNMSKNADGMGNYVYNVQEVWLVLFLNIVLLLSFLFWIKKEINGKNNL